MIDNFKQFDPFSENDDNDEMVHIRVQQSNGRRKITTIEGLDNDLDCEKIRRYWTKEFNCNGTIIKDEEMGDIIQLSGDQRKNVFNFLVEEKICNEKRVKMHGF